MQERAGFGSRTEAETATRAALSTLGEYLTDREGLDLAAQLPQGLREHLRHEPPECSKLFSYQDFIQRIGEEEGVGPQDAAEHARAAVGVLEEAVSESEMQDVRRQFPGEFAPLFG